MTVSKPWTPLSSELVGPWQNAERARCGGGGDAAAEEEVLLFGPER